MSNRIWASDEPEVQRATCDGCKCATECRQILTIDADTLAKLQTDEPLPNGLPCRVWTLCQECQANGAACRLAGG